MRRMVDALLEWLRTASWLEATAVFLVENLVIFALVVVLGNAIARRYRDHRVSAPPEPTTRAEIAVALGNVLLNTAVTLAGLALWRRDIIRFRSDAGLGVLVDVVVLLAIMDFCMYLLHRVAHTTWLYPIVHRYHHRAVRVRPLTLFALNPIENLAFGTLWLVVVSVYPASWIGMSVYLATNVAFGTIGHLGVEPLPSAWVQRPALRHVAGSSFHAQHHADIRSNFGFYTLVWDRLFGTLRTDYDERFGRLTPESVA